MAEYTKPLPVPDLDTQPFWDGCSRHELLGQRCVDCGAFRWPPRGLCPACRSWKSEWVPLAGTGVIDTHVTFVHVTLKSFADDSPYPVIEVMLDGTDGAMGLTSTLIDATAEQLRVGLPVTVVFDDVTPEVTLPKFRPA